LFIRKLATANCGKRFSLAAEAASAQGKPGLTPFRHDKHKLSNVFRYFAQASEL
jgi:hypothetical protein